MSAAIAMNPRPRAGRGQGVGGAHERAQRSPSRSLLNAPHPGRFATDPPHEGEGSP